MALIAFGRSRCPLCDEPITKARAFMGFYWIETDDPTVRMLSDGAAHVSCLQAHPKRGAFEKVFSHQFGLDGTKPNGSTVVTFEPGVLRGRVTASLIEICHVPQFLLLDMPLHTAEAWLTSRFWRHLGQGRECNFQRAGFSIEVRQEAARGDLTLVIRCCPHAYLPDDCPDPELVGETCRKLPVDLALGMLTDWRDAVASLLARHGPD